MFDLEPPTLEFNLTPVGKEEMTEPEPTEQRVFVTVNDLPTSFGPKDDGYSEALALAAAEKRVEEVKQALAPLDEKRKNITQQMDTIREEMQRKLDELAEIRRQIDVEQYDLRRALREANQEVLNALRALERALEAAKFRKEYQDASGRFDELIVNMPWREKAMPHQIEGAKQIAMTGRAILGDKMGLGKSLTSLAAADMLMVDRLLIIVPDDVVSNFVREVRHWAPHRSVVMLGKQPKAVRSMAVEVLKKSDQYTVVLNYSAWRKDKNLLEQLKSLRFQMAILDEAHTIKNVSTSAYKGCKEVVLASNSCPECGSEVRQRHISADFLTREGIYTGQRDFYECLRCEWDELDDRRDQVKRDAGYMRSIKYVVPMTGTVILNKPTDLFALLSLVQPEVYTSERQFIYDYCMQDWDGKIKFKPGGMDALTKRLAGRYIARDRKSAGVVLPKQEIQFHNIEITPEEYPQQYRVIQQLTKHAMIMLDSGKQLPILHVIALITRKRQANVLPAGIQLKDEEGNVVFNVGDDVRESIKLDRLCDLNGEGMIPDFTEQGNMELGERVVVFSQFKEPLKELESRLNAAGISVVRFDGDTPEWQRDEVRIDFDRKHCEAPGYEPKWQVVLCNYKTGGVGLNFTAATQIVILDEEWNPGKNEQAYGRVDRIGQTEESTVHILQLERTVDTWMRALNEEKQEMISGFETSAKLQDMLKDGLAGGDML